MKVILPLLLLLFAIPIYAESTGNITLDMGNVTVSTGITGYTVNVCNATSDCLGITCFLDYDNFSLPSSKGWCNFTALTYCQHNGSAYSTGNSICTSNESYRTCTNGVWSINTACPSGQTCNEQIDVIGSCESPGSSSSSSSGTTVTSSTTRTPAIIFTTFPADFNITQGTSVSKTVSYKNSGNQTLYNLTITIPGIDWYSVSPTIVSRSYQRNTGSFTLAFSPTDTTEIKTYTLTVNLDTHNASTSDVLKVTVNPSEETVQEEIIPNFAEYSSLLATMKSNLTSLEAQGYDVEEIKGILINIERKINETNSSLEAKDYVTATQLLADAKGLIDAASEKMRLLTKEPFEIKFDAITLAIIGIIVAVVVFVVYTLLPAHKKERINFRPTKSPKILEKLKKK